MGLSVSERETFRKAVKKMISQMTKSDIVAHFTKQEIGRSTIYNTINRIQIVDWLKDNKRTGRPTTAPRKKIIKRLANNRTGVSQRRLARKFDVHQTTVSQQLTKMGILYRKSEKTPKYSAEQFERLYFRIEPILPYLAVLPKFNGLDTEVSPLSSIKRETGVGLGLGDILNGIDESTLSHFSSNGYQINFLIKCIDGLQSKEKSDQTHIKNEITLGMFNYILISIIEILFIFQY
jgi:transposase